MGVNGVKTKNLVLLFMGAILLAVTAAVAASAKPDGLEWVAERLGFLTAGEGKEIMRAPMADYAVPAVANSFLSTALAGIAGTAVVFCTVMLFLPMKWKKKF